MSRNSFFRTHPLRSAAVAVAGFFAILVAVFGITRTGSAGEVMGRVEVAGVSIGGMTPAEATTELRNLEERLLARQISFSVDGRQVVLDPREAGFDVAEDVIVQVAMRVGRQGNGVYQFIRWLERLFSTEVLELVVSTDDEGLDETFDRWETEVIAMPPRLGAVVIEDGVPQPVYPAAGLGLDREAATAIITESLVSTDPANHELPIATIVPQLSRDDVDAAVAEAIDLLSEPIRLVHENGEIVFTAGQLTAAYRSQTLINGVSRIMHSFDPAVINGYLKPVRVDYEAEPMDAEFAISGDEIDIIPGTRGTRIDEELTAQKLLQAAKTTGRVGQLPIVEDADPDVTVQDLEALGIEHLVSSFTTYHPCCENRVVNIQTMAHTLDGYIVMPGEEFSIK